MKGEPRTVQEFVGAKLAGTKPLPLPGCRNTASTTNLYPSRLGRGNVPISRDSKL